MRLRVKNQDVAFSLSAHGQRCQWVLQPQEVRLRKEESVSREAWCNMRAWVMAALALYETEMVDVPQGFLPLATAAQGQTMYEKVAQSKCGPGDGKETVQSPDL